MKILHKLIKFGKDSKLKAQSQQTEVSFHLKSVPFTEQILKKRFTEGWDDFSQTNLPGFTGFDWKTHPSPMGKSQIELFGTRKLDVFGKLHYLLFPKHFIDKETLALEEKTNLFLEIENQRSERKTFGIKKFRKWMNHPRKIFWQEIYFERYENLKPETYDLPSSHFHPLVREDKMTFIVKWARLHQISYLWRKRIFDRPFPLVGEVFLKSKRKFSDGSFGESCFVSLGYCLPNRKDHYFLSYWGLTPVIGGEWQNHIKQQNLNEIRDLNFSYQKDNTWFGQILFSRGTGFKKKKDFIFVSKASEIHHSGYEKVFLESTWERFDQGD